MAWLTDAAVAGAALVLAGGAHLAWRRRPVVTAPRLAWPAAVLVYFGIVLTVMLANTGTVLSFKKTVDSACAVQTAANTGHGDFSQTIGQLLGSDVFGTERMTIFSRGYSIFPWLWALVYAVTGSAIGFMLLAGAVETLVVFGAGFWLAWVCRRQWGDDLAAACLLLAYGTCFINHYLAIKDTNGFVYSLLGFTGLFIGIWTGRRWLMLACFVFVLALRELHLPWLLGVLGYGWLHGRVRLREWSAYAAGGAISIATMYYVVYPLAGTRWLMAGAEHLPNAAELLQALPAVGVAIAFCLAVSGGALLVERKALALLLVMVLYPVATRRIGDWYEFYSGYIRLLWPLPFFALVVLAGQRPAALRRWMGGALLANMLLAWWCGPLPLMRVFAHAKSIGNLERYTPRGNAAAYRAALALVPPGVPVEASVPLLAALADRPAAYPLTAYSRLEASELKRARPPEFILMDFVSDDLLDYAPVNRARAYAYLEDQVRAGYGVRYSRDAVAVLQRGHGGDVAASAHFVATLAEYRALSTDELHIRCVRVRHGARPPAPDLADSASSAE